MAEQNQIDDQSFHAVFDEVVKKLLPLDPYSRVRVYRILGTYFGFEESYPKVAGNVDGRVPANLSREPRFSSSEAPTPKEFLLEKKPETNVERVACLAYYLTHYRDTPHFKNTDINLLNTEAAQIKLSNVSYTVNDAVKTGYLAVAPKGTKQLSANGEQYVQALPDRGAAKEVKPRMRSARSRRKTSANRAESGMTKNRSNRIGDPVRITIYNHKGGVGKTTLAVNIAFALSSIGKSVLVVDSDPQCNLTSYLLSDDVVDDLLDHSNDQNGRTIWSAVKPVIDSTGSVRLVDLTEIETWLYCRVI